ncbi:MAG: hypothetical protein CMJ80_13470 [Planctomycetaceae bacterium]|nr:hypothetical protein [Planctomycetaceae bacterium]
MGVLMVICFWLSLGAFARSEPVQPQQNAHAHNDYLHAHPLQDALDHGFCSVEADVYVVGGDLLVAHDWVGLQPDKTLRNLYLAPLYRRIQRNSGHVYKQPAQFTLLIDFKSNAAKTYPVLAAQLAEYKSMLVRYVDGRRVDGPVEIIISGNRPTQIVQNQRTRFVSIHGRLANLEDPPNDWMPLVSDNWTKFFAWRGEGPISQEERRKLREYVRRAHKFDRRIRFWKTPDTVTAWQELVDANVDLINTDNLTGLSDYLKHRHSK